MFGLDNNSVDILEIKRAICLIFTELNTKYKDDRNMKELKDIVEKFNDSIEKANKVAEKFNRTGKF